MICEETPRHLRIETYYLREIQHVKDHVLGMVELALPDLEQQLAGREDWEQLTRSFEGQFQILFGSLELIRSQMGEENYHRILEMTQEVKRLFLAGDDRAAAFLLQDMDRMGWGKRSKGKGTSVAQD